MTWAELFARAPTDDGAGEADDCVEAVRRALERRRADREGS